MKTLIIAGNYREAQDWVMSQWKGDTFRSAIKTANGIGPWDNYHYVAKEEDLMGREKTTPIIFIESYWESPVYKSDLLKTFSTPIPAPQKKWFYGMDMASLSKAAFTLGMQSGKSTLSAGQMAEVVKALENAEDIKFLHDSILITTKGV